MIARELKRRRPDATLDVLTADPAGTAQRYGVETTPRGDLLAVRAAIARSDVVLSGGGGLLQNATSTGSLLYYAGIIRSSIAAGKTTMIFAQSIGPLDVLGRAIVRVFCRGLTAATVRDERSRALLARLLPRLRIERTADPVFLVDPPPAPARVEGLAESDAPLVVVSVRSSANFAAVARTVATAIDHLGARYGARTVFLPFGGPHDAELSSQVIRMARSSPLLLPEHDLEGTLAILAGAQAVIGMRLHALILAARLGVPFVAIPYDPKVRALCDDLAYPLPPLVDPAASPPGRAAVESAIDRLWGAREDLAERLRAATAAMRASAERNFAVLDELL